METLYSNAIDSKSNKKESKNAEKLISKYLNQKHIKKVILNGLKEKTWIRCTIDDKTIELKPEFEEIHLTKSDYKYMFTITQNDEIITYMTITPTCFNSYLEIELNPYHKEKIKLITSQKILDDLKLIIGSEWNYNNFTIIYD